MVAYGGATQDALASAYAVPFEQQTGANVVQDPTFDYAKLAAMVKAGNVTWDLVEADPFSTVGNCGTLYQPVNVNLSGISPNYIAKGDKCGVPADVYSIVLMYNTKDFKNNPPKTWADFFNTTKFPGKRGVFNYVVGGALEAASLADGATPSTLYPLNIKRAIAKLDTIKSDIVFYNTLGQSVEQLLSGNVAMAEVWNTRAYSAVDNGATYAPAWDGNIQGWDSWAIPKGSQHVAAAEALMKVIAEPQAQANLATKIPFGPTVRNPHVAGGPLAAQYLPSNHTSNAVFINQEWWSKNLNAASNAWNAFAAG
jgi:putative spermidine/putrescine transport system substrate-binding protein